MPMMNIGISALYPFILHPNIDSNDLLVHSRPIGMLPLDSEEMGNCCLVSSTLPFVGKVLNQEVASWCQEILDETGFHSGPLSIWFLAWFGD